MIKFLHTVGKFVNRSKFLIVLNLFVLLAGSAFPQDTIQEIRTPCIIFPSPMYDQKWQTSIGFISTTTPQDITEEVIVRAPAGDFRALRKIGSNFNLEGRVLFQFVQNHFSLGLKWTKKLSNRVYFSAGDDVAFWHGKLEVAGFDSKGSGWMNYPNISFGYRTKEDLLFTFKSEAMINTFYTFSNGGYEKSKEDNFFNGTAFTFALEQPFYNKKHLTLAFTAMYTNFYWVTWSLFETFDRYIFYPQITVGFII